MNQTAGDEDHNTEQMIEETNAAKAFEAHVSGIDIADSSKEDPEEQPAFEVSSNPKRSTLIFLPIMIACISVHMFQE